MGKLMVVLVTLLAAGCASTAEMYDRGGNLIGSCKAWGKHASCVGHADGVSR